MNISQTIAELTAPDAFFEVVSETFRGREYRVFKHAPQAVTELIQNARGHAEAEFLIYRDQRLRFCDFFAAAESLLGYFQTQGLKPGDRVAIAMKNRPEWLIAFAAAVMGGAVAVPINSWGQRDDLLFALQDSGASWLICDDARGRAVEDFLETERRLLVYEHDAAEPVRGVLFDEALAQEHAGALYEASAEDPCMMLYTSGSTGAPKGVMHRHRPIVQAVFNMMFTGFVAMTIEGARELRGGAVQEKALLNVPLFHGTGLLGSFVLPMVTGQAVVIMPKWDAQEALRLIDRERVTMFSSVPALVKSLLIQDNFDDFDTRSLQRLSSGGAAVPSDLPALVSQRFEEVSNSAGYGMTETLAVGSTASGKLYDMRPKSSGVLSPIIDMRFVDPEGAVLSPGESGEIEMRGITVTEGYWNRPEASAQVLSEEGWLKSGDVGHVDTDGFLFITGRIKEIVIRGGENIFPGDVEQQCYAIDAVQDCVVFGVPDETLGEELVLIVRPKEGESIHEAQMREALQDRLPAYKVPKHIVISTEPLLRGATEKFDKLTIRAQFLAGVSDVNE